MATERRLLYLLLFFIITVSAVSYYHFKEDDSVLRKSQKVRLGLALQPGGGLIMVALKKGFFSQEGLDVEVTVYPSGKRAFEEGLYAGNVDMITSADIPIAVAAFAHSDFKVIANMFASDNVNRIIASKKSGITSVSDLKGKRIATQRLSAVHFFLLEHGIEDSDENISFMKAEELPVALLNGDIDAFSMREPIVGQAKMLLEDDAAEFSAQGIYMQIESLVASDALLDKHPQIAEKFLRGMLKAQRYIEEHPAESFAIIADYLGVEKEKLNISVSQYGVSLDQSSILLFEEESRWIIGEKVMPDAKKLPNILNSIDYRPLEKVKPDAVTIIR